MLSMMLGPVGGLSKLSVPALPMVLGPSADDPPGAVIDPASWAYSHAAVGDQNVSSNTNLITYYETIFKMTQPTPVKVTGVRIIASRNTGYSAETGFFGGWLRLEVGGKEYDMFVDPDVAGLQYFTFGVDESFSSEVVVRKLSNQRYRLHEVTIWSQE